MFFRNAYTLFLLLALVIFSGCEIDLIEPSPPHPGFRHYLHISHTRADSVSVVTEALKTVDYDDYGMLWLGGDLAHLTSLDDATMTLIDSIFQVGEASTLWALGNHDYTDLQRVQAFTHRPPYYTHSQHGITVVVLDTQDSLSNIVGPQLEMLRTVVDTLQESSHLILLHHKLIWLTGNPSLEPLIGTTANMGWGHCFSCLNPNNFYTDIYPELLEVKARGIEVICIGGDLGIHTNEFQYTTPEGIHFLASGLDVNSSSNQGLLFEHDLRTRELTWRYIPVADL
jgi:hypothetical protein